MESVSIALAGNPNVGKSTLFNALTGLRQHTGNWPGKTVDTAVGAYVYRGKRYRVTDLPGLYSLRAKSPEESVAASYLSGAETDCAVVVCDATCLARSLVLALQVAGIARRMVLALNLSDEARSRGIRTDAAALGRFFHIPVVEISAARREGLDALQEVLRQVCDGFLPAEPDRASMAPGAAAEGVKLAAELAAQVQTDAGMPPHWRSGFDRILLSRAGGWPAAALLLLGVLWLTVKGANAPGSWLERVFAWGEVHLTALLQIAPDWLRGLLIDGIYGTVARVVTVMLPPMAIFFPLFALLEDFGLLPRLAFLTDRAFERCGACGKQALTSCMSLGCNAVGVMGCRIIDSPRERLLAILTCSLLPCNGRFPALILLGAVVLRGADGFTALFVSLALGLSFSAVLLGSRILSKTVLRGTPSGFVMELPPYRTPRVGQVLLRSFLDRTLRILGRAVIIAAPAGAIIWICARVQVDGQSILAHCADFLGPPGRTLGMSGPILLAFILGFPANELVIPVLVMLLTGSGTMDSAAGVTQVLTANGMGAVQALCTALFCLFHWPCGPTVLTVWRETGSLRWTALSVVLPTAIGAALCLAVRTACCLL